MKITEGLKTLEFDVTEYQYPHSKRSQEPGYDYDANWLRVQIKYQDPKVNETYNDPCLLTDELHEIIDALEKILAGKESSYISDFLEPYLRICIARIEDRVVFVLHFVYDTTNGHWKDRKAVANWSLEEAAAELENLKLLEGRFHKR